MLGGSTPTLKRTFPSQASAHVGTVSSQNIWISVQANKEGQSDFKVE